jgi:hypothetical protein
MDRHATRFLQSFQPERRRSDFGLLVRGLSEIIPERAPESLEPEQRDPSRAGHIAAISQT